MDNENKQQLPEAPASATVKIKSKQGFEYLFTLRDEKASTLMFKIDAMEKKWLELGWTPLAQAAKGGFPPKPVEYVENRFCPKCQNKLVYSTTKAGKKFIKCSTNKWINGQSTGCSYVDWMNEVNDFANA